MDNTKVPYWINNHYETVRYHADTLDTTVQAVAIELAEVAGTYPMGDAEAFETFRNNNGII